MLYREITNGFLGGKVLVYNANVYAESEINTNY